MSLTLVVSSASAAARTAAEAPLTAALDAAEALRATQDAATGKMYAQHALGRSLAAGALKATGATLANTAVVVCGRNELLLETEAILRELPGSETYLPQRVFMNI